MLDKIKGFLKPIEEEDYDIDEDDGNMTTRRQIHHEKGHNLALFEPVLFEDTKQIANCLMQYKGAVVNLHKMKELSDAQRTIDFLTGVIYALEGKIQKVADNVIIATPPNISVEGQIEITN